MITTTSGYDAAVSQKNTVKQWLLKLESSGTDLYFSTKDITFGSQFYRGQVLEFGSASETLDLVKWSAGYGDITIKMAQNYPNATNKLSAELFGGTDNFINQDATITEYVAGCATGDAPTVYQGRLVDIKHDAGTVTITLERRQPWDLITIESDQVDGIYQPIVYGAYTPNASTRSSIDECDDDDVWKTPVVAVRGDDIYGLSHTGGSVSSARMHFYEPNYDKFVPLLISAGTGYQDSSVLYDGTNYAIPADWELTRAFEGDKGGEYSANDCSSFSNIWDVSSYAYNSMYVSATGTNTQELDFAVDMLQPDGDLDTDITISFDWSFICDDCTLHSGDTGNFQINYSGNAIVTKYVPADFSDGSPASGTASYTITGTAANDLRSLILTARATVNASHSENVIDGRIRIRNLRIEFYPSIQASADVDAMRSKLNGIKYLYCGADGLSCSFSGGSGLAEEPPEIYRDVLKRWTGINYSASTISGMSDLVTARHNWDMRINWLKPLKLKTALEEIQSEGAFVWLQGVDAARVVHVESSYGSGDVDITIDGRTISDLEIDHTPFSKIVTKTKYKYGLHPESDDPQESTTQTNANRSDYNFATDENIETVELKYLYNQPTLTSSSSSLGIINDQVRGEPHYLASMTLLKPADQMLEIGDIVQFENMEYEPYNGDWNGYWIITKTSRSIGSLKITAQEIYHS